MDSATKPRYYWDACAWIALIRREAGKVEVCDYVIERSSKGEVEIWTSAFTLAEVYKRKCDGHAAGLPQESDQAFEDYLAQDYVTLVQVDADVGKAARRLLRQVPSIGKPQDAVHVATALLYNLDELHTFDRDDLLGLDGQLDRLDGEKLKICNPPQRPDPNKGTLFEPLSNPKDETIAPGQG